jgi:hypothetical protein
MQKKPKQEGVMEREKVAVSARTLGIISLIVGFLGGAFCWWTPLGMVLSISGLAAGFIGWTFARRTSTGLALSIAGIVVSVATLILNLVIADLGLELIKLHAFR